jgi:hypothetical protein
VTKPGASPRDDLDELYARLDGGVCRSMQSSRPAGWPKQDERSLASWPPSGATAILATMRALPWEDADRVGQVIDGAALALRNRDLLKAVLLAPAKALSRIRAAIPGDAVAAWFVLCWTASAASRAVCGDVPESETTPGDLNLLAPLAARLQFLVFSEPLRWRGQEDRAWWARPADEEFGGGELVRRVLGDRPWHELVGAAADARRAWLECLDSYQSHLLLARAEPAAIEEELAAAVFRHPPGGAPLGLSDEPLSEASPLTAEDMAVLSDITERHLLPRFNVRAVIAIARYDSRRAGRVARMAWAGVALGTGLAAIACACMLWLHVAAVLAAACYLVIGAGVVAFGSAWAAQWLLRLPAASAIGIFILMSLLPGGWLAGPRDAWAACAVLASAAVGYLLVEVRNHGVAAPRSLLRAGTVFLAGAGNAVLVSLLGLVVVAPAFVADGSRLSLLWRHPGYRNAGILMLLAASWCLAVGVFSQVLWDDRPITAPLAHLSWRAGR